MDEYGLIIVVINDEYHLYDLWSDEIYEAMSLDYIKQLLEKWNKRAQWFHNYDIIKLVI